MFERVNQTLTAAVRSQNADTMEATCNVIEAVATYCHFSNVTICISYIRAEARRLCAALAKRLDVKHNDCEGRETNDGLSLTATTGHGEHRHGGGGLEGSAPNRIFIIENT